MVYSEAEIRIEALRELAGAPDGQLTTTELIEKLENRLNPTGKDAEIADGRGDTYFSQKVRNLVSHRNQGTGLVARELARYDADTESWTISDLGRQYPDKAA